MPQDDKQTVGLTRRFAQRTSRAVQWVESQPINSATGGRAASPWTYGNVRAKCTEEIGEGTWDELGTGKATIYHFDGSAWTEGEEVDVVNQFGGGPIEVDNSLLLAWVSGFWFVSAADGCPLPPEEA